jgi:hypothetical protein
MNSIAKRLSVPELSQRVLEMAQTGVYRESVFEALQPLATKKQIRVAIAHAKRFGLHSVASLRDAELGTYYQLDVETYQSRKHLIHSPDYFGEDADLIQRVTHANTAIEKVLKISKGSMILLLMVGIICSLIDNQPIGFGCLCGSLSAAMIWLLQKSAAHTAGE